MTGKCTYCLTPVVLERSGAFQAFCPRCLRFLFLEEVIVDAPKEKA